MKISYLAAPIFAKGLIREKNPSCSDNNGEIISGSNHTKKYFRTLKKFRTAPTKRKVSAKH